MIRRLKIKRYCAGLGVFSLLFHALVSLLPMPLNTTIMAGLSDLDRPASRALEAKSADAATRTIFICTGQGLRRITISTDFAPPQSQPLQLPSPGRKIPQRTKPGCQICLVLAGLSFSAPVILDLPVLTRSIQRFAPPARQSAIYAASPRVLTRRDPPMRM